MDKRELEKYLISKPNVIKCSIPGWKYIRYTVYDLAFATLESKNNDIILTVWGRYETYEKEYPDIVVPSVNNEPRHFTSILLSKGDVPDHVIKSLIDNSYKTRLRTVVMPRLSGHGREDIPYRLLDNPEDKTPYYSELDTRPASSDVEAAAEFADLVKARKEIAALSPDVELIGVGILDNFPYMQGEDEQSYKKIARLKAQLKKYNK